MIEPVLSASLAASLRSGGPELEQTARELAAHGDQSGAILDRARSRLLRRLHRSSDDFAATRALQAVNAATVRLASSIGTGQSERVRHLGLSSNDRTRLWLRSASRRVGRPTDAVLGSTKRPPPRAVSVDDSTSLAITGNARSSEALNAIAAR